MKTLRFLATADWHADGDPVKEEKLIESLKQIYNYVSEIKIEAIIIAGDIWEKKQSYSEKSAVPTVIYWIKKLSEKVNFIFITKGNNSHDEPGSISLLHQLEHNIFAYEYPVCLHIDKLGVCDLLRDLNKYKIEEPDYIVSLIPYPTKASFISETSIDNNNAEFIEKFEQVFELIGDITSEYQCPKMLAFHGNVVGSRLSTGQTLVSQDIMVAPSTLEKAKADYYALGHIHLRQFFKSKMGYSGSIYNKSWGETEQKSFELIEFEFGSEPDLVPLRNSEQVLLTAARPMIKIDTEFKDGKFYYPSFEHDHDGIADPIIPYSEYRLRITVKENDRKLITDDTIEGLKFLYGQDTKIEFNIIPVERESRSEKIMECKTLVDEVCEYAVVIGEPVHNGFLTKVAQLQEVE